MHVDRRAVGAVVVPIGLALVVITIVVVVKIATGGSIDFHSAMPENRGVAAGVAMAIAAAKNAIG
jgi:hypothetical protein